MSTAKKVLNLMMERDAFSQWLGLKIDAMCEGSCRLHYVIKSEMLNGFGIVHGGVVFSAADSAFAFACNSQGRLSVALDVSITFTKSAAVGDRLFVEAKEVYLGYKTSVYEIRTTNEKGEIVAIFKGTAYRTSKEHDLSQVKEQKDIKKEDSNLKIVNYEPRYAKAFRDLNVEWISKYFVMEAADYKALDNPDSYITSKGGHIFIALLDDEPVGAVALIKTQNDPDFDYELGKMAVSPKAQGKNIGYQLGMVCIEKAKALGGKNIFLESNTILTPAITLYYKLGFKRVHHRPSPYERSNIQMELVF